MRSFTRLGLLLVVARTAAADDGGFATLDRQTRTTELGAALTYFSLPQTGQWTRLDLAAQVVQPTSGFGGYAQIPFAYESDANANRTFALGGLEVGGLFAARSGLVLHLGIVLPTASSGDNANVITTTAVARDTDLVQALPNSTSGRAGIAYEFRSCDLFGRIEFGIDVPLVVDDSLSQAANSQFLHLDAALGFDAEDLTLAIETTNAFAMGNSSTTYDVIAAAIRFRTGNARPYLAAVVPLDSQHDEPKVAFVAGVVLRFPN